MKRLILTLALFALVAAPAFGQAERSLKIRGEQAEDTAHVDADYLMMIGAVRNDSPIASLCGTTNDNCALQVDDTGNLYVVDSTGAAQVVDLAAIEVLITAGNVDLAAIEVTQDALVIDAAAIEQEMDSPLSKDIIDMFF